MLDKVGHQREKRDLTGGGDPSEVQKLRAMRLWVYSPLVSSPETDHPCQGGGAGMVLVLG
jgi:hypothetical protein